MLSNEPCHRAGAWRQAHRRARVALLAAATAVVACQTEAPAEPDLGIENPALGLRLANAPEGFAVTVNEGSRLELEATDPDTQGRMWIALGEVEDGGINLVEIVNSQEALFEAMAGGAFSGSREMVTQFGPAYYSRGQFDDGSRVEEVRIFSLHPGQNRLMTWLYRYPLAEDSADRVAQLFALVGELEALEVEPDS